MKKVLIVILVLAGFSVAGFAQTAPVVKKNNPSKTAVVKKTTDKKIDEKAVAVNKVGKPAVPAETKKTVTTKPTAATVQTASAVPLKKDGTPDKRYKASQATAAGQLKKDGTPDQRYKANKKHS